MSDNEAKKLIGCTEGLVEYNRDPADLGRCKIRLLKFHYDRERFPTYKELPWARPGLFSGAGYLDGGEFDVPPLGTWLWITSNLGDFDDLIYLGGVIGKTKADTVTTMGRDDEGMGEWVPDAGKESPLECQGLARHEPTRHVIFKTPKGAMLMVEERDGVECLRLIDRGGQAMEMSFPVSVLSNLANGMRRGVGNAIDGGGVSVVTDAVGAETHIKFVDGLGQMFLMKAKENGAEIQLVGRAEQDLNGTLRIVIDSTPGAEAIRLLREADGEESEIRIDSTGLYGYSSLPAFFKSDSLFSIQGPSGGANY